MPNQTVKVIHEAQDSAFFAYADKDMLAKWRNDKSIPLVDVVQNHYGSEDATECLETILGKGKEQVMSRDYHKEKGAGIPSRNARHANFR
ncbi:hypothetical protein HK100_005013 [Physocladia obscura]|uniref:Ribosome maturation protein SDO1/SBDS N-terminal domain-containing protein n=1 Tax=Physocladia obscura TaxID=109957 RepID=A0AAD5T8L0_9FUNG|nr:hypothetical protein HK100_005013 [Physocladia obscura]